MKPPRTPAQMAREINDLNCHVLAKSPVEKDGKTYDPSEVGYGPVTVAQMEAIYAEVGNAILAVVKEQRRNHDLIGSSYLAMADSEMERAIRAELAKLNAPVSGPDEARKELSK